MRRSHDPAPFAQRLVERLAQADAYILGGVVLVDI
jgi:hypothetical protein